MAKGYLQKGTSQKHVCLATRVGFEPVTSNVLDGAFTTQTSRRSFCRHAAGTWQRLSLPSPSAYRVTGAKLSMAVQKVAFDGPVKLDVQKVWLPGALAAWLEERAGAVAELTAAVTRSMHHTYCGARLVVILIPECL